MAFLAAAEGAGAAEAGSAGAAEAGAAGKAGAAEQGAAGTQDGSLKKLANSSSAGQAWKQRKNRRAKKDGSRNLNDLHTQEEREAELDRRREEAAAPAEDKPAEDKPAPATAIAANVNRVEPMHAGGGFVLGLFGWVLFRNFLEGGMPQVKRWGAAKFFNKTGG